jgi:very-short-patch-repair endonuclease
VKTPFFFALSRRYGRKHAFFHPDCQYSLDNLKFDLYSGCQEKPRLKLSKTTSKALVLYLLLRKKGIAAELEKSDGHKKIDIAVVEARLNIEVDGSHRNRDHNQALTDLERTLYSFARGFYTLRIPNSLLKRHPIRTADYVEQIINPGKRK